MMRDERIHQLNIVLIQLVKKLSTGNYRIHSSFLSTGSLSKYIESTIDPGIGRNVSYAQMALSGELEEVLILRAIEEIDDEISRIKTKW